VNRMRAGEWVAGFGAVALLVLMFFDWFAPEAGTVDGRRTHVMVLEGGSLSGWSTLGWFMDLLVAVAIFGGLALSYMTVKRASPAWPVGAAVLTWILGTLIVLVLLVRTTIAQPWVDALLSVQPAAYLGLVAAALIPLGGFLSLRDERMDSAEARDYTPPPARPVPGT
jgi:heme/copper-type cytochrome/quinol oxidase subunit 3